MGIFGKQPEVVYQPYNPRPQRPAAASVDQAISTGAMREGHLSERIAKLEYEIAGHKREMQRYRPGTSAHTAAKRRAVQALKKKKILDAQAATVSNGVFNLEQVKDVRDQIKFQKEQAEAIKASHQVLVKEQQNIDLDAIQEAQDDITDTMAEVNEVSEALGRTYEVEPIDESELMAELEGFEEEDMATMSGTGTHVPSYLTPAPVPGSQFAPPQASAHPAGPASVPERYHQ